MSKRKMKLYLNKDERAFPRSAHPDCNYLPQEGMTLRQWYAGQALTSGRTMRGAPVTCAEDIAKQMFEIADAMIAFEAQEFACVALKRRRPPK